MILARTQSGQKQHTGGCNSGAVAMVFGGAAAIYGLGASPAPGKYPQPISLQH